MAQHSSGGLPSLTIVLPAYNEEALIAATLDRVVDYLLGIEDRYSWEILAISNGLSRRVPAIGQVTARPAGSGAAS